MKDYNEIEEDKVAELARLIKSSKYCVVLTGAGVSTESGIPDFRSPGTGLWTKVDPMAILSNTAFRRDPVVFYKFIVDMVDVFTAAEPNECHMALARFEEQRYIKTLITQNIDGLHRKAGSRHILEVHGNAQTGRCIRCGKVFPMSDLLKNVKESSLPPSCDICGAIIKPDIVLFEDPLPMDFVLSQEEVEKSDLLLVIGSSLQVAPVCYLPSMARRFAIINLQPTSYDGDAELIIRGKAGVVMNSLEDVILAR